MPTKRNTPFTLSEDPYYKMSLLDIENYTVDFWDVSETISELSYLTHSYFRYYGKFPSKIGKLILEDLSSRNLITKENDVVFDNYAGSGTTLVEAKLRQFDSYGIDINPFAILACKVKTRNYDTNTLSEYWNNLYREIMSYSQAISTETIQLNFYDKPSEIVIDEINVEIERFLTNNKDAEKWFSLNTIKDLSIIKHLLLARAPSTERDFFELAFFSIIRRVSFAHDGEVRPHVNPKKRERNTIDAFSKKVIEMIDLMKEWNSLTFNSTLSDAFLCNNSDESAVTEYINSIKEKTSKELGLVVSHPPYLNCFDYIPVYKLKFMWADSFDDIFAGYDYKQIKAMELRSYPANSHENIAKYFVHNISVYKVVFDNLRSGGYCCVVIGDCTIEGELFEVHKAFISMLEEIGFVTEKIAYRSTAYGIGQYAYKFRADYNEDAKRKKDGVIFFKKP